MECDFVKEKLFKFEIIWLEFGETAFALLLIWPLVSGPVNGVLPILAFICHETYMLKKTLYMCSYSYSCLCLCFEVAKISLSLQQLLLH